jgi:hypothetical protein
MKESAEREYIAFISYRHCPLDSAAAKRIQRGIERYTVPKELRDPDAGKRLGQVFRDEDELPASSSLSDSITHALDHSRYLLVICTPDLPKSPWCEQEILYFLRTHDRDHVLAVLVDGEPEESFSPLLLHTYDEAGNITGDAEPLAANIAGPDRSISRRGFRKELIRLIAAMLGCPFDSLWQRDRRARVNRVFALLGAALAVMAGFIGLVLDRNARITAQNERIREQYTQISDQNEQITRQYEQIAEQNEKITGQYEQISQQNEEIARQYAAMRRQLSTALVDSGYSLLEDFDLTGALENGRDALLTEEEAELRDPRAELLLNRALCAFDSGDENIRSRVVYTQSMEILELKRTADGAYVLLADQGGSVRCLDGSDLRLRWTVSGVGRMVNDSLQRRSSVDLLLPEEGDLVLCVTEDGVTARSLEDGTILWQYALHNGGKNTFRCLRGDTLLLLDRPGERNGPVLLLGLDVRTGSELWQLFPGEEGELPNLSNTRDTCAAAFSPEGDRCAIVLPVERETGDEAGNRLTEDGLRFTVFDLRDRSSTLSVFVPGKVYDLNALYGLAIMGDGSLLCAYYDIGGGHVMTGYHDDRYIVLLRVDAEGGVTMARHRITVGSVDGLIRSDPLDRRIPMAADGRRVCIGVDQTLYVFDTREEIRLQDSLRFTGSILSLQRKEGEDTVFLAFTDNGVCAEWSFPRDQDRRSTRLAARTYGQTGIRLVCPGAEDGGPALTVRNREPGTVLAAEPYADPAGEPLAGLPDRLSGSVYLVPVPESGALAVFTDGEDWKTRMGVYDAATLEPLGELTVEARFSEAPVVLDRDHVLADSRLYGPEGPVPYLEEMQEDPQSDSGWQLHGRRYLDFGNFSSVRTLNGHILTVFFDTYVFQYSGNDTMLYNPSPLWLDGKLVPGTAEPETGLLVTDTRAKALGKNGWVVVRGSFGLFPEGADRPEYTDRPVFAALDALTGRRVLMEDPEPEAEKSILAVGTGTPAFACAYETGRVCLFDPEEETCRDLAGGYGYREIAAMCWSPGDDWLLILTRLGRLEIWTGDGETRVFSQVLDPLLEGSRLPEKMTCSLGTDGRLQILNISYSTPGWWTCLDPDTWTVTAEAEDVFTASLGDGRLYALRDGKLTAYPLRDAAALKAWAEAVLEEIKIPN